MNDEESSLRLLAGAYFHQDFRLAALDVDGVVRQFVRDEGPEDTKHAADEVAAQLARSPSEEELAALWTRQYHAQFNPTRDGLTYRRWFERMLEILRTDGTAFS